MVKATDPGMDTALALELTKLASAWLIERADGTFFRFTTNTRDVDIDVGDGNGEQTYSASEGYSRTNMANDSELNVGNLDIAGMFDNDQLQETELRRGLFDFADVKIFFFDWDDSANGIIKILRGTFGEVVVTDKGLFKTTLRDMTTVFSRKLGEKVSKDCRDDLGGPFCMVPTYPDPIAASTDYAVGDFVRIPDTITEEECASIIMNFEDIDAATGSPGMDNISTSYPVNPATIGGTAQIDTAQAPAGGDSTSSLLLDGNSDFVSYTDNAALELGAGAVTMHCYFRLAVDTVQNMIAAHYDFNSQRSFLWQVNASNFLEFSVWLNGTTLDITLTGTTAITAGVDYHAAIVRKDDGDWVLTLEGGIEAGPTTPTGDPFDTTATFRIGATHNGVGFFNGWIDSFVFLPGVALWDGAFTPPTGNIPTPSDPDDFAALPWSDFADTIFECTDAGTTGACIVPADFTFGNAHDQNSAEFTARRSWSRLVEVIAVGSDVRRDFTVTELTPNTGHTTGAGPYTATYGYEDDFFNGGLVVWETGDNAGIGPKGNMEIRDFIADDGATIEQILETFTTMPFDIQVGDTARMVPGCDKVFQTCIDKYNNPRRFKGEPFVAGADILGQYPDAPQG